MNFSMSVMDGRDGEEGFDPNLLAFEWEPISFEEQELLIQITFENPE
jgi:hypothetical protein